MAVLYGVSFDGMLALTILLSATASRTEFVATFQALPFPVSKSQVTAKLGPPDDILTEKDGLGLGEAVWAYGTQGHGSFPTLGTIKFKGDRGQVNSIRLSPPPPDGLIPEPQMEVLLRKLATINIRYSPTGDTSRLVEAANSLIPLGKRKALAVLEEYENVQTQPGSLEMFWLVRTIFRIPGSGSFPDPMHLYYPPLKNRKVSPRHPFFLIDDVPLSAYCVGSGSGPQPQIRLSELKFLKAFGVLRSRSLALPADPFVAYQKILTSPLWVVKRDAKPPREERALLRTLLMLVRTAYRPSGPDGRPMTMWDIQKDLADPKIVQRYQREFLRVGARWDERRGAYVRHDGTMIPDEPRP